MALDGEKLRRIRTAKGFSQEKLALLSNVNKRTIQRAEKGAPISLETAAFIAEAVGVLPSTLRSPQTELFAVAKKAWNDVILVPVTSARRIVDALRTSFAAELTFDVEPTKDNVRALAELASLLEPFQANPWAKPDEIYEPAHSEILEKQAAVNALLPDLADMGVGVFVATYTALKQMPLYDLDDGQMYVTDRTPFRPVQIALVVISDTTSSHLVRQPSDVYDDEPIPF